MRTGKSRDVSGHLTFQFRKVAKSIMKNLSCNGYISKLCYIFCRMKLLFNKGFYMNNDFLTQQYIINRQENGDMKNCDYQFRVEDKTVKIFPPGMEKFIEIFFSVLRIRIDRVRIRILDNKKKSPNFSKHIYSISLISKSKILLIFKSEPKP